MQNVSMNKCKLLYGLYVCTGILSTSFSYRHIINFVRYIKHLQCPKRWFFRRHNFQDGFTNFRDGSRPGQPKTGVTNAYIAAVAGLNKRDARLTVKSISHSVCISSGSAHKNLTQSKNCLCSMCTHRLSKNKKATFTHMPI